ncbi:MULTISPECIES: ABC transporter permease [unclassified Achromobacter]|uniref:ABC transporter permease n=1 Tax=unclassified Achromobacter TaxID=2626865 RepID=UPI000B51831A|nr:MULTISPECIES: ABC transporter permease [unclassified Achromobacter]OWT77351.1 ABC transporter permease [Achromobacter sp. HZ28]OWT78232.1 ABC transporter permease [Achromobacter sp. HZ34]
MAGKSKSLRATVFIAYFIMLIPVGMVVITSFFSQEIVSFPPQGWSLKWYANALVQREFSQGFLASIEVALIASLIGVPLGTLAALAITRRSFAGKEALKTLLLGPLAVPGVVAGTALFLFYLNLQDRLDVDIAGTLPGLIAAHVLLTIPWTVRVTLASLQGLDLAAEEAAANLGAHPFTVFYRITLPALRPGLVAAAMFSFIQSFENLELTLLLVGPGMTTLPIVMLNYLEFRMDPTLSAIATIQIVIVAALMLLTDRFVKLSRIV